MIEHDPESEFEGNFPHVKNAQHFFIQLCGMWIFGTNLYSIASMYGIFTYIYHKNQSFM